MNTKKYTNESGIQHLWSKIKENYFNKGAIHAIVDLIDEEKADINSPAFTGTPTAPTALPGTNNNQIATTAFVMNAMQGSILITISNYVASGSPLGLTATASLYGGTYSNTATVNSAGQFALPLAYYGDYVVTYSDPRVKGDTRFTVSSNVTVYGTAKYSQLITYTLRINESNSNPSSACDYMDDAVNMTKGSSNWDTLPIFNDILPCVFKDGAVQYYLNPENFNQKVDGTAATLDGTDGDVMIEFRRFAYRIYRENNYLYVSITNDDAVAAADARYTYDAFSRLANGDLDKMYIGAFKGYVDANNKLRSIAGVQPTANKTIGAFRTAALANGAHYQQSMYSHLKALQCLYLIKYGNRNGLEALGKGIVSVTDDGSSNLSYNTGGTLTNGMCYGSTANGTTHVKLFGIEDFWGNIWEWVDGLTTDADWNIVTSWNNFTNEDVVATTDSYASGLTANASGWNKIVAGTTAAGFMPVEWGGSSSTYWADLGYLSASRVLKFGGRWYDGGSAGPFYLDANYAASAASRHIGARLSYN